MPRQWTIEQREHRAAMIRRHKPWQKSTGPKTLAGKNTSKMNAHKHGARSAIAARLRAVLRRHSIFLKAVDAHWKKQNLIARYKISTNELIDLGQNPRPRRFFKLDAGLECDLNAYETIKPQGYRHENHR